MAQYHWACAIAVSRARTYRAVSALNAPRSACENSLIMSTFSFVIFTDSHLTVDPKAAEPWWNAELLGRSSDILTVAVEDAVALEPEFVVHLGDVTDKADRDSFQVAGEILSKLNCTLHFTPGNHDTWTQGSRHVASELLQVSGPPMYRSVPYKGWRLLLIDSAYWMYQDGTIHPHIDWDRYKDIVVPPSQVEWIERELQRDPDTPTLCFIHVPLALREQYPPIILPPGCPSDTDPFELLVKMLDLDRTLADKLSAHTCVKAVFSGHGHWHDCIVQDSTLFCQTAALVEYPCEFRKVTVWSDRLDVETVSLSRGDFPSLSLGSEARNTWTAGRPQDRTYSHPV